MSHCMTTSQAAVINIAKWDWEYLKKPLSLNTVRCCTYERILKLYNIRRMSYQLKLKQWICVLWSDVYIFQLAFEKDKRKMRKTFSAVLSYQSIHPSVYVPKALKSRPWFTTNLSAFIIDFPHSTTTTLSGCH